MHAPVSRLFTGLVSGLLLGSAVGCGEDEAIRRYSVPKPEPMRLLGAIVPHEDRVWFFKLVGPTSIVSVHRATFEEFVRSVGFDPPGPITWVVPPGWEKQPGSGLRYATFRIPYKNHPLDLTVIPLGPDAGNVLENVNRWRDQIGLPAIGEEDLPMTTTSIETRGGRGILVDLTGPGSDGTPRGPSRPTPPLTFQLPEGWVEVARGPAFSVATFRIGQGGQTAEVTVTPLSGPAGGLLANVNRWRGQLQLPPTTEEELARQVEVLEVAGQKAQLVDLLGPEGPERQRLIGIVVPRGGQTWFFKLKGPAELVGRQKAALQSFVQSVRFSGGVGEGP
ncbi:MAG: hypothetical protein NZ700_08145 [Gemmataceae bacterium]|nr:hypothetical protein [Gemmataceae bacterium]MDW8264376.1 hypothetical protein [Gemmataceae bacterium]